MIIGQQKIFSEKLLKIYKNKKGENTTTVKRPYIFNNRKPNSIPKTQMELYGYGNEEINILFDTEKELIEYIKNNDISTGEIYIVEFIGKIGKQSDVIKQINHKEDFVLLTHTDTDGYSIYKGTFQGEYIWDYTTGSLKDIYEAFRQRGIILENDIYHPNINIPKKKTLKK